MIENNKGCNIAGKIRSITTPNQLYYSVIDIITYYIVILRIFFLSILDTQQLKR